MPACVQIQRYEGASTAYGPHTLGAYISKFEEMGAALAKASVVVVVCGLD